MSETTASNEDVFVRDTLIDVNKVDNKVNISNNNGSNIVRSKSKKAEEHNGNLDDDDSDNDDDDDDEITKSLERIGVTIPSFMIPRIDLPSPTSVSKRINDYLVHSVSMENSSSSNIKELLTELFNKRTSDLKNLYTEVSDSLTGIVNTNIDHPIDEYIDELQIDDDNSERHTEEDIINKKKSVESKKYKELEKYEHLTYLTFDQFQDQKFLRHRIKQILSLEIDPVLQRLLIQKLMSRSYIEKQNHIKQQLKANAENKTAQNINGQNEYDSAGDSDDESDDDMEDDEVFLTAKDRTATYYSLEEDILGCQHYQRNCKVECSICHKWYTCRFCHDEVQTHHLKRENIKFILCMFCFEPQHPQQYCVHCNKELSKYYCDKCILYDNDPMKNIYHCDKCGICRLGMGLNQDYFHCDSCNACISIDLQKNHVCIENSTKSNCPICDEFMFNSNEKVVFMTCGHPIHDKCYKQHTLHSYKCPTCSKTITNMELQFRMRDAEIKQSKMPEEIKNWETEIKCNDCGGMSRVPFHYLGHKCDFCHSYNTMQVKLIKDNNVEVIPDDNVGNNSKNNHKLHRSDTDQLYVAEKFVTNSLNQNFEFDQERKTDRTILKEMVSFDEIDQSIDHNYVDNFIKVINNFEAYSSIGDAFKDWISISLINNVSDDDDNEINGMDNGNDKNRRNEN